MRRPAIAAILALTLTSACSPNPARSSASPASRGSVELIESAPIETTLDHPDIPDAHQVWPAMIGAAERTLDIAQFYVSSAPESRLEPVIAAVEAAADRGVAVRFLADALFAKRYPETLDRLAKHKGIALRRFDVGPVMGGVLHAKYFVVDGREAYLGSQNFDWRSLTHIQEIGVRVKDARVATAYAQIFALDWDLAGGARGVPALPAPREVPSFAAGEEVKITPVASPRGFLPDPASWELPRLIALLDGARRSVHVQVLAYKTTARDGSPFPDLDDALRRAAARGVEVKLLVADWSKRRGTVEDLQRLARVPGVSVRFFDIPPWSGGFIPFARVAHAKYLVVDGARAWVGTSNWEGDYFTKSRNVGLVIEGGAFAARLEGVFQDGFAGRYAEPVDPDRAYEAPKIDEK